MTQKEYQENIEKLKQEIKNRNEKIQIAEFEQENYKQVLENNAVLNSQLRMEEQRSNILTEKVKSLEELIEHYKVMLGSININVNR